MLVGSFQLAPHAIGHLEGNKLRSRYRLRGGWPPHVGLRQSSTIAISTSTSATATKSSPHSPADVDRATLFRRFGSVAMRYWTDESQRSDALTRLGGVVALTLGTTGVSVGFSFIGKDFWTSLSEKSVDAFHTQLGLYLGAFVVGIPVFVLRDYYTDVLALRWRSWLTSDLLERYMSNRAFYAIESRRLVDNPDQRVVADVASFTGNAIGFALALLNSGLDLVAFSGILFTIYPPLFGWLILYAVGGTALSVRIGKSLIPLNFQQEALEANLRFALVRVRENAESIALYGGEGRELREVLARFRAALDNAVQRIIAQRNLDFFTSYYRYIIQVLPAALVAPIYFQGDLDLGQVQQSYGAFNHILGDLSLVVFQFQSLSSFSAVVNRLGELSDELDACDGGRAIQSTNDNVSFNTSNGTGELGLSIRGLNVRTPDGSQQLIEGLDLDISFGRDLATSVLVIGPSGAGKTSLLRTMASLWTLGDGCVSWSGLSKAHLGSGGSRSLHPCDVFFLPQKPYMILGTLRQQLLYPAFADPAEAKVGTSTTISTRHKERSDSIAGGMPLVRDLINTRVRKRENVTEKYAHGELALLKPPSDSELEGALRESRLGPLLDRLPMGLDTMADWSLVLSLGEQQRIGFARLFVHEPRAAILDESTSGLDVETEAELYSRLRARGIGVISVGHRPSLRNYHDKILTLEGAKNPEHWHVGQSRPGQD